MDTLLEFIFIGEYLKVDLSFLKDLLKDSKENRFNYPEGIFSKSYKEISEIFKANNYVDFVISTDHLNIKDKFIKRVFINLGLNDGHIELLFFFDLKDLKMFDSKQSLDFMKKWMIKFKEKYGFKSFICQMDNANSNEYYFDDKGVGPLYDKLVFR